MRRRCSASGEGDSLRVGIVERKAHAEHVAADETLPGVRLKPRRILVSAPVEQKRRDRIRRCVCRDAERR